MRIIYITTVSSTMNAFFKAHIEMLVRKGHSVDLACNDTGWPIDEFYSSLGCKYYHIDFSRSPLSKDNIKAYKQLKRVIEDGHYDIAHCHTPNASVITRLVCRRFRKRTGLKVFYTAHGFHFYKGAPKLNWMVYYPIEKFCSRYTDKLITINQEDYELAKSKFKAKEICYVPGVGIDLSRFENIQVDREEKRREIGVPEDAFLLLSVGELNENKNHQVVIRALAQLRNPSLHYAIAGVGDKREYLLTLASELGVSEQFHLLGYRKDVVELYKAADAFCFPSFREGLSVSLMEAMACGSTVLCSMIRGNVDLVDEKSGFLFDPQSPSSCKTAIEGVLTADRAEISRINTSKIVAFSKEEVVEKLRKIYEK